MNAVPALSRRKVIVLCLLAAASAAFLLIGTTNAQEGPEYDYVDLVMTREYDARDVAYSVLNIGTATATGVTVSFHIQDLQASDTDIASSPIMDKRTDDDTKEQSFTWEVGTILPGSASGKLTFSTGIHQGYDVPRPSKIGVITATAYSIQPEPDFLLGNNEIKVYSFSDGLSGSSLHMEGNKLGLLLEVSDLRPAAGDDVNFDLTARNFQGSGSVSINLIADAKVKVELSDGLGFKTSWSPPTEFVKSGSQSATWSPPDTDVDSSTTTPYLQEIEIQTQLTTDSLDNIPLEERCITAWVEDSIPPPSPDYVFGSLTQCLGDVPTVVFEENQVDLFTLETNAQNDLELVTQVYIEQHPQLRSLGLGRADTIAGINTSLKFSPEKVIIQVKDSPSTRGSVTDNSVTSMTWQTKGGDVKSGIDVRENVLALGVSNSTASTVWTDARDKLTASGIDGASKPGTLRIFLADESFKLADADNSGFSSAYDFGGSAGIVTDTVVLHFGELGTYEVGRAYRGTHDTAGTKTTDEETYTFHVGPVAELGVRDAGTSPEAPADQRAFTIVAVNNGPDDAPAAQVTVTGLNAGDYGSHTASQGTFNSTTGIWEIGELRGEVGYYPAAGHPLGGPTLTIITSADVDTEITAEIENTQDYEVCIDSDGEDLDYDNEDDCEDDTANGGSWHTTSYYDYNDDNDSATIQAKDGTGADLLSLRAPEVDTASIIVTWDAETEVNGRQVTHYEIEWSADGETNWQQLADDVSENRYVDTGVNVGDTRYYRVRAVNDWDHKGPWSVPIMGTVPVPETASEGRPEAPVLTASLPDEANGRTQIDLAWEMPIENGAPITSYTVEVADRSSGPWAPPDPVPQLGRSDTAWSHTGLTGGTRKYYRMKATNSEGDSDWSEVLEASTRAAGMAGPPLNLRATPDGDSAIDLSWDPPLDDGGATITYYEIQWSPDGTTGWRSAGNTTDGETLTFKQGGMTFGTTRYYRVAARNSVTLGEWSGPPVSATTLAGVPGMPNLTARAADANTIGLTWTVPADNGSPIIRYELEWSPDGSDGSWTSLTYPLATDTSYSDGGLDPGTERHYRIRAVNGATPGEGSWSTVRSATTPPAVPGAPALRAVANGQDAIDLSWDPPSDDGGAEVTGYELQWSADGSQNSYSMLTNPSASARSYTHSGLQPGTTRHYQLRARNQAGWGEFSPTAAAATLTGVPAAPGLTVRANGPSEIKLSWTKPDDRGSDINRYQIQESGDGSNWTDLARNIPASDTEYVHDGLSGGTTKHYRVRALNDNGEGQWSQSRSATTDAGGPGAPVLTLTVMGDNRIDLGWTVPADNGSSIRGYWVERSAAGDGPWERLTSNNRTTAYSDTDLYRGMTRHYRVAAFNGAGTGPYSNTESATTTGDPATAPEAPTLLYFSNMDRNQVTIAWDPPADDGGAPVSGYEYEVAYPCEDDPNTPDNESDSNCGYTGLDIEKTTGTSARITGLNTRGTYYFRVRAANSVGKGEWAYDLHADLYPSNNGLLRVSPATVSVNEGAAVSYTVRLSHAPPHPVVLFIQLRGIDGTNDLQDEINNFQGRILVPSGWTHPNREDWSDFTHAWNQGVQVSFTAPEDTDALDDVVVAGHDIFPIDYGGLGISEQDWKTAWQNSSAYGLVEDDGRIRILTGAGVKITVRDND